MSVPVFPSTNGQLVWPRSLSVGFNRVLRDAGLPETMRFHDLRHSCATLLIQQGVDRRVVTKAAGCTVAARADITPHRIGKP
jgi:integrase